MMDGTRWAGLRVRVVLGGVALIAMAGTAIAQQKAGPRDPAEPPTGRAAVKAVARPTGGVMRATVDEKGMRELIAKLVKCGSRLTIGNWDDPKHGPGCGR